MYLTCNLVLNSLNFYWFAKMIETVRKRFQGKPHDESANVKGRRPSMVEQMATELDRETLSGAKTPSEEEIDASGKSTAVPDGSGEVKKR